MMDFWGGADYTCYPPTRLTWAEHQLDFRSVDPVSVVRGTSRLSLSQLIVMRGTYRRPAPRGIGIYYIFGRSSQPLIADPSPPEPKWVVISEGHEATGRPTSLFGGQAGPGPGGATWYHPWYLQTYLPHRQLGLLVISNEGAAETEQIGQQMTLADR